ncbi:hypothetical protein ACFLIM_27865 [Nonomuraea sp. M3C6]|uniref:Uncharacterized protein n=2 Tax=Nonomuraea marmarensis TaxID=3351344 RepID=A0ABW7AL96_9ACTN
MNVSLDLRIEQVPGDNGAGEWLRISEELHREFNARARALTLMVHGRVIYETMEEYQPRAREDASLPDVLREYGEIWTAKPKVLVSRTRSSADHNTRIIGGDDAIEQLAGTQLTVPYGNNDHGQIVGVTSSSPNTTTSSGFLRDARGHVTTINRPGAAITAAFDINDRGQIVGVAVNPEDLGRPAGNPAMDMPALPGSAG